MVQRGTWSTCLKRTFTDDDAGDDLILPRLLVIMVFGCALFIAAIYLDPMWYEIAVSPRIHRILKRSPSRGHPRWRRHRISVLERGHCLKDQHEEEPERPKLSKSVFCSHGKSVYGWPSSGGLLVREDLSNVELDFLRLPRFKPSPRPGTWDREDLFCERLQRLGARHFESEVDYLTFHPQFQRDDLVSAWLGWPSSDDGAGCWLLARSTSNMREVEAVDYARNMHDRCNRIRDLGGNFYDDWASLKPLLQNALRWKGRVRDLSAEPFAALVSGLDDVSHEIDEDIFHDDGESVFLLL